MPTIDFDELISYYAKRGDTEMLSVLRHIREDMERQEDPDYEPEESETESEVSIDTEDSDSEVELDENGCVPEEVEINPSMNGFCSIV
tara:strand:- start:2345 stop:2608 length:264 start_codon:yes stop_codon:yes gene_type:complete